MYSISCKSMTFFSTFFLIEALNSVSTFLAKFLGFPGFSVVMNLTASAGNAGLIPGSGRSPWGGNGKLIPVFLPGKSHGQRSLAGYSPKGRKRVGHDWSDWAHTHACMHKTPGSVLFLKFLICTGWIKSRFFCKEEVCFTEKAYIF